MHVLHGDAHPLGLQAGQGEEEGWVAVRGRGRGARRGRGGARGEGRRHRGV